MIYLQCFNIHTEEATAPLLLFLHHCLAVQALCQESGQPPALAQEERQRCVCCWRNFTPPLHFMETLSFLPIESWPTGRKELEINGGRTERGSCSPSQAHTTGPTSLPKFKEKNLARLVSIANPARCLHNQIILLFSHLLVYFFSQRLFVYLPFLPNSAPNLTQRPHHPTLVHTGIPIKPGPNLTHKLNIALCFLVTHFRSQKRRVNKPFIWSNLPSELLSSSKTGGAFYN